MTKPKRKLVPIIDKKFQVKTTFSIIGVVTIISLIIVTSLSIAIINNNKRIENIYEIEDAIVHALTYQDADTRNDAAKKSMREIAINHEHNMQTLRKIMDWSKITLFLLIAYIIIQGIILFYILIRKTHRISGPIYVMSNYMRQIISGKMPVMRPLRVKDELKEFYLLFQETVTSLSSKTKSKTKPKAKAKKTAGSKAKAKTKTKKK